MAGNLIDALSSLKQHATAVHVRSTNELDAFSRKLVRARTVLPVVAIFHQQRSGCLKFGD
ncbi:MAG TPA: hypothetical protein VGK40_11995 [Verrucomicrobiae bacterium]